jgi:hypothetical protein
MLSDQLIQSLPEGFRVEAGSSLESFVLQYWRTGMRAYNRGFLFLVLVLSAGMAGIAYSGPQRVSALILLFGAPITTYLGGCYLTLLFLKRRFIFKPTRLRVESRTFGLGPNRTTRRIPSKEWRSSRKWGWRETAQSVGI